MCIRKKHYQAKQWHLPLKMSYLPFYELKMHVELYMKWLYIILTLILSGFKYYILTLKLIF